jgi:DNA-binding SARP family transcriptional activator
MIGFRPKTAGLYLARPRLLAMLPDAPGYVVWLEAPYGHGKSVLAAQWAEQLEADDWRVVWLSPQGRDVRTALTQLLTLPNYAPWGIVLDTLWQQNTMVVIEDLTGGEEITALLKDCRGLLLIASRAPLNYMELPRLQTQARLIHLTAETLRFQPDEAQALFDNPAEAKRIWQHTQGWALPLHFTALTGQLPEPEVLLEGFRESLVPEAWEEILLLAAVPYLPEAVLNSHSRELIKAGITQELESGLRLHPLISDTLLKHYQSDIRRIVRGNLSRLPILLRGEACEKLELADELAVVLEEAGSLSHQDPGAVLRWDKLAPGPRSAKRGAQVGWSLWTLGRKDEGIKTLFETAEQSQLSATDRLTIYKQMVWILAQDRDFERARQVAGLAEPLIAEADQEQAGRYLNNLFLLYFEQGDWETCAQILQRSLEYLPLDSPYRPISRGNLAITEWHRIGDLDGLILERSQMLETNRKLNPNNVPGDALQLAELYSLLGNSKKALTFLEDVASYHQVNPRWTTEALALQAYLQNDPTPFAQLLHQSGPWEKSLADRVRFFWARTLRRYDPTQALTMIGETDNAWTKIERALCLHAMADPKALTVLGEKPPKTAFRELCIYWQAARYTITREVDDLRALVELTLAKERILPGLISLEALPSDLPNYGQVYPLTTVLHSEWKAAIALRYNEIPPLDIKILGQFTVTVLKEPVDVTDRQKAILALLLLGFSREAIGEALWAEADTKKVRNNLNVQLNLLRKVIEPWGVSTYLTEDGLQHTQADIWQLQAAIRRRDASVVLALYHPNLAPGIDVPGLSDFAETLKHEVTQLLYDTAQHSKDEAALPCLERILELDPIFEEALQELLRRLLRRGRRREAQRRLRQFTKTLHDEMGLEPLAETQAILTLEQGF